LRELESGSVIELLLYDKNDGHWRSYRAGVIWSKKCETENVCNLGLEFIACVQEPQKAETLCRFESGPEPADLEFLLSSSLMESVPRSSFLKLLDCLERVAVAKGESLITQGDQGDALYIIQDGICQVKVQKDGKMHRVARLRRGEVVGEMSVLTGEPRGAHVVAATNMVVWKLGRDRFYEVSSQSPGLLGFLTDLVANRFETSSVTADRTIGKYLVKHRVGKGGWGIVYYGLHKLLHRPVAVKMMKHDMAMEEAFLRKFREEGEIIARLNHPNIVQVYDVEEAFQTLFIIMEYLEGNTLKEVIKNNAPLDQKQVLDYLEQILSGLEYSHSQGIVHRDIKPANIYVGEDDRIKILDFGLACPRESQYLNIEGTPFYAAPEQIECEALDERSDIFSLGIMTYEMVVGRRPYGELDLVSLMDAYCDQDIPDPGEAVPGLSKDLREFIVKACRRKPEKRYQSAAEALAAVRTMLKGDETGETARKNPERLTTLLMLYADDSRHSLDRLLEEFCERARGLGVKVMTTDYQDI
jgi:CRP-like cAMP-binding protein/tRNA A-37 threonylcarbamoyl transferase component Bud32